MLKIKVPIHELQRKKLFIATPMYGGQCLSSVNLVETEDGPITIKQLVDTKYSGKVKSYNKDTNSFCWNSVIGHSVRKNTEKKKWVKVHSEAVGRLVCTDDHECAVVNDPLFPDSISYVPAKDLEGLFSIHTSSGNELYNKDQMSAILGVFLGDGYITKNGNLKIVHSQKQLPYLKHLAQLLGVPVSQIKKNTSGYGSEVYSFNTTVTPQLKILRKCYNPKKSITGILPYLNNISLAYWYMDDGYRVIDKRSFRMVSNGTSDKLWKPFVALSTDGFSESDVDLLVTKLKEMGIESKKIVYKKWFRIKILNHDAFFSAIAPYVHESMYYKLPEEYKNIKRLPLSVVKLDYTIGKVTGVRPVKGNRNYSKLYDIEVENTHNFVANNTLVHNCTGMFTRSMTDLVSMTTKMKIPIQIYYLFNESLITRARAYCTDEFMRSDSTHMLFIDSDIGFDAKDIIAMMAMQTEDSPYDVLCAPYPKKTIAWEKIKTAVVKGFADKNPTDLEKYVGDYVFNPKSSGTDGRIPLNQPVEILEGGTGFMMIRRKTLERYQERFPELWYKPDHVRTKEFDGSRPIMMYFDCAIDRGYDFGDAKRVMEAVANDAITPELIADTKAKLEGEKTASMRYLSEDYFFSRNVQKAGMKIWLCPWIRLNHTGTYVFGGSLIDLAQIGASATADPSLLKLNGEQKTDKPTLDEFMHSKGEKTKGKKPVKLPVKLPGLPSSGLPKSSQPV